MSRTSTSSTVRLPVAVQGDPGGIPLVLIHGFSDSLRSWEPVMEHLSSTVRTLAVTLRGHGDAPKPEDGYDVAQLAADVAAALDEAGIDRAVVAGHSMGSVVSTRLALDAPDRVAGLVLMGGKTTFDDPGLAELYAAVDALQDPVDPEFVREFQESCLARPVAHGLVDRVVAESLKLPARVWQALVEPTLRADHSGELRRIVVPTLIAWGELDEFVGRADQDALLAAIPGSRLLSYPGGGHAFHWEDPATVARDLTAFAAEALASGSSRLAGADRSGPNLG